MLKIKEQKWRGWVRLLLKVAFVALTAYVLFGIMFGVTRGNGNADGDLLLFCRVCRDYEVGDMLLMMNGETRIYGDDYSGEIRGKVMAELSVRGF